MAASRKRGRVIIISDDDEPPPETTRSTPRKLVSPGKKEGTPVKSFPETPSKEAKFWIESMSIDHLK